MSPTNSTTRLLFIDALRGIAALAVTLYHFTVHYPAVPAAPSSGITLRSAFEFLTHRANCGVDIFFVISGFVIAYSLRNLAPTIKNVGVFIARRSLRLDPPYFATIALALGCAALSRALLHDSSAYLPAEWTDCLVNMVYLQDFLDVHPIVPVAWTLCIEIQFYLTFIAVWWLTPVLVRNFRAAGRRFSRSVLTGKGDGSGLMNALKGADNPESSSSDGIVALSPPSPPVLGGRGRGEEGQGAVQRDQPFAWDTTPPHPCPSPPEYRGRGENAPEYLEPSERETSITNPNGVADLFLLALLSPLTAWSLLVRFQVLPDPLPGLFIEHWYLFQLGVIVSWVFVGRIGNFWLAAYAAVIGACLFFKWDYRAAVGLVTATAIVAAAKAGHLHDWLAWRPLQYVGRLSYSLYLVHTIIGSRIMNIMWRLTEHAPLFPTTLAFIAMSLAASLVAAEVLYRLVEKPSVELAKRLRTKQTPEEAPAPTMRAAA